MTLREDGVSFRMEDPSKGLQSRVFLSSEARANASAIYCALRSRSQPSQQCLTMPEASQGMSVIEMNCVAPLGGPPSLLARTELSAYCPEIATASQLFTDYQLRGGRIVFALPFKSLLDVLQVQSLCLLPRRPHPCFVLP